MRKTDNPNINTRTYWNSVYGTPEKRQGYALAGTSHALPQSAQDTARFQKALAFVKAGDRVLDLGCGVGVFTKLVKDTYPDCEVVGADISDQAMRDNTAERSDITYLVNVIGRDRLDYQNHFDVVFSGETLEHLDDPADLFADAHQYLASSGLFILTTPNGEAIRSPEHTWIFDHEDIERLYTENGFAAPEFVYLPDMEHLLVIMAVGRKR